jgi:hypothetical protein
VLLLSVGTADGARSSLEVRWTHSLGYFHSNWGSARATIPIQSSQAWRALHGPKAENSLFQLECQVGRCAVCKRYNMSAQELGGLM